MYNCYVYYVYEIEQVADIKYVGHHKAYRNVYA